MSIKKLAKLGIVVTFYDKYAVLKKDDSVIGTAYLQSDLYEFKVTVKNGMAHLCCSKETQLWHSRLGHLSLQNIKLLERYNMLKGIADIKGDLDFCEYCIMGKQCRKPFDGTRKKTKRILERVHTDVCGPFPETWDGYKYFVAFIDDFSHFSVVYLLKNKSDVFGKFKEYEATVNAIFGTKISRLRADQGTEYSSKEQMEYYKVRGIQLEQTVRYTPTKWCGREV